MTAPILDPSKLNPLPEAEDSNSNLITVYDVSRGQLYSVPVSRVGGGTGTVETIVAGTGISVDATDAANPIVTATGVTGDVLNIGLVAPTTEGNDGEYYYNIVTGLNYGPKTAGSWGSPISDLNGESWFETKQTVAISSGEVAVDYNDGRLIDVAVAANITDFSFTNWPADGTPGSVTFRFTLGGTPPYTIAFSALGTTVRAEGGVTPAVPEDVGSTLIVTAYSSDALATVDLFIGASDMKSI